MTDEAPAPADGAQATSFATELVMVRLRPFIQRLENIVEMEKRPELLAHYTSLDALEQIMSSNELWFSSPLFMNDFHEMRFGMLEGQRIFQEMMSDADFVAQYGNAEELGTFRNHFEFYFKQFDQEQALDIYVFCLSEHAAEKPDGLLSMWRGYGSNGNGAALVFRTDFLTARADSPLLIAKVIYASEDQRRGWLREICEACRELLLAREIGPEHLWVLAAGAVDLFKVYSLLAKHPGFDEEREWRVIYLPERDRTGMFNELKTYLLTNNVLAPKLRFPIRPLPFEEPTAWTFRDIVQNIVLGPSHNTFLAVNMARRMLRKLGKDDFVDKVSASAIPLRPS